MKISRITLLIITGPSFVRSEIIGIAPGIRRLLSATEFGSKLDSDAASSRKLQYNDVDDFETCVIDSVEAYNDPELEQAILDFAYSYDVSMDTSPTWVDMTLHYSNESKNALRQICSDVGGYYVETSKPITCTATQNGTKLVQTVIGVANCSADTIACRSADILLDSLNSMFENVLGGRCSYDEIESSQRALRGARS